MPALGTRSLKLEVEGVDYSSQVSSVRILTGESDADFVSFADAAAGGAREYRLAITMLQNTDTTSLWYMIWSLAGTEADVVVRPNGGTTPSTTAPQFLGTVIITEPDGDLLGGDADRSASARFTTEVEWVFTAKPVLDTTA